MSVSEQLEAALAALLHTAVIYDDGYCGGCGHILEAADERAWETHDSRMFKHVAGCPVSGVESVSAIPEIKAMEARMERLETAAQEVLDEARDQVIGDGWDGETKAVLEPEFMDQGLAHLRASLAGQPSEGETK